MTHRTTEAFWRHYHELPGRIQQLAQEKYRLLENNPRHPSLHFKKIREGLWSARVNREYRTVALRKPEAFFWIWIGPHDEYERLIS